MSENHIISKSKFKRARKGVNLPLFLIELIEQDNQAKGLNSFSLALSQVLEAYYRKEYPARVEDVLNKGIFVFNTKGVSDAGK